MYTLVAFQGPSGSGKTTLQHKLGLPKIVTWTTRPPRQGEVNGVDYYFVSMQQMSSMIDEGKMLEFTNYKGNIYGSTLASVNDAYGLPNSIVLDANGIQKVRGLLGARCLTIGVYAPKDDCQRRLGLRSTEDSLSRLSSYQSEVDLLFQCDIVINNSDSNTQKAETIIHSLRSSLTEVNED